MPPLWLIGMMGAGKSTVGERVAVARGCRHLDIDSRIAERAGISIPEIFAQQGEGAFRDLESEEIRAVATDQDVIVSTGGGAVLDRANVDVMRESGAVAMLNVSVRELTRRLDREKSEPSSRDRPVLGDGDIETRVRSLMDERAPFYESAAHYVIDSESKPEDVVEAVGSIARYQVGDDSTVLIGPSLPRRLLVPSEEREQVVVLVQEGSTEIGKAVMARLESEVDAIAMLEVPDREEAKTFGSVEAIYRELASLNVGRHDTIVGVGGGALTDVAGFVAATWLRGIESTLVPTTLLGAVDAAIGGKTGINVEGKNLVGAFWHPTQIAINIAVLSALPEHLAVEGAAEAIKAGFIADPTLVSLYADHGIDAPTAEIVRRAVAVKTDVVSADFRESGVRAILNFGHTIGHGIEPALGIPHGYAVAIGMVAAAAVSEHRFGFDAQRVIGPLAKLGLPTDAKGADATAVRSYISRDKKRTADGLRMVLLRDIGDPTVEVVDSDEVDRGLAAVGIK